jgi:putative heme-binding domain-containing protein
MLLVTSWSCKDRRANTPEAGSSAYLDTSVHVYGTYLVYKLPVTKGANILNPVQLALGTYGRIYASNQSGEVYTLEDTDGDGLEDSAALYVHLADFGLHSAASMAFRGDTIFIAAREEIRAFLDRNKVQKPDTSWTVCKDIPYSEHPYEWTSGLTAGRDGWLYFAVTTDSWNAGASPDPNRYRGANLLVRTDGSAVERLATGIRSVQGMAQHPDGRIFFLDNAGGGNPTEELNLLKPGAFYGHNKKKFTDTFQVEKPVYDLSTEIAPAQIVFNTRKGNFGDTDNDVFVSFYGPAERWSRGAIGRVRITGANRGSMRLEEYPVADIPKLSGLAFGQDGAQNAAHHGVADYWYNSIETKSGGFCKLVYDPAARHLPAAARRAPAENPSASSIEKVAVLFKDRACFACHSAEKDEDLLGPPLRGIGQRLSREEILAEINEPSKIIKSSMGATRITKKNGQVLLGRMVSSDEASVSRMLIGNTVVRIPGAEIANTEDERKSLMYERLLNGLGQEEVNNLIDYLVSLK